MHVAVHVQIQDARSGFLVNGYVTVSATVLVLEESVQFTRDADGASTSESLRCSSYTGKSTQNLAPHVYMWHEHCNPAQPSVSYQMRLEVSQV